MADHRNEYFRWKIWRFLDLETSIAKLRMYGTDTLVSELEARADEAIPRLLTLLRTSSVPQHQKVALEVLTRKGDARAVPILLEKLDSESSWLREESLKALLMVLGRLEDEATRRQTLLAMAETIERLEAEGVTTTLMKKSPDHPSSDELDPMEIRSMWQIVRFEELGVNWQDYGYLVPFSQYLNLVPSIFFTSFNIPENETLQKLLDILQRRSGHPTRAKFLEQFLNCPSVQALIKDRIINIDQQTRRPAALEQGTAKAITSECIDSLMTDAFLAKDLYDSGIFTQFRREHTAQGAKILAADFRGELFGGDTEGVVCLRSQQPWSNRFFITATTYLMIDTSERRIWLLCVSDGD